MTKKIFNAICTTAVIVFAVTTFLILGVLYEYFTNLQQKQLRVETYSIARGIALEGTEYLENLEIGEYRITWIDTDGTVIYDSSSDVSAMENHLQREEVKHALADGEGESSRYSSTLLQRSIYCAVKNSDGTVVRLAIAHNSVFLLVFGMLQPIFIILILVGILSYMFASGLARKIVKPLNTINLDDPLNNDAYEELTPLLKRISKQQIQLKEQKDILDRKQNEFDVIVGSIEEGMLLLDYDGRIISINNSAMKLLKAEDDCLNQNVMLISRNPDFQDAVSCALKGEKSEVKTEIDDRIIYISSSPLAEFDGKRGVAVVLFDITVREKAEEQRKEFTANVSHELKTPLHSISGYSELMKCGMVKAEDIIPFSEKIHNEAQRLISLVNDIISLSHLESGEYTITKTDVDVYDVTATVIEELEQFASACNVKISVKGSSMVVQSESDLVHQIIYNLCDNAIKYNRDGGEIFINIGNNSISIKDTGIGIPAKDLERIFERFYRVDKSRSKSVGGTGLGLSIVKHASTLIGAKINVVSELNKGTEFEIRF